LLLHLVRHCKTVFPQTHRFRDDAELFPERVLTEPLNTSHHEDEIGRSAAIRRRRVVAEEVDDPFPKADGRLGFVAFPAVVDLAEDAYLGGGLALGLAGQETPISQVSTQGSGFLEEISTL